MNRDRGLLVLALISAPVVGVAAGTGYGIYAVGAVCAIGLCAIAFSRPVEALLFATCLRFVTDIFGNETSGSSATIAATVLSLAVCGIAFLSFVLRGVPIRLGAPGVWFLLLVAWIAFRSLDVLWTSEAQREVGQWGSLAALFFAGSFALASEERLRTTARVIVVGGIAQTVLGTVQIFTGRALAYGDFDRAFGTFPHPSWLAFYLAVAVAVLPVTQWHKGPTLWVGLVLLAGLVLTLSRGPMVFLLVWALVYALLRRRFNIVILTGVTVVGLAAVPAVRERFLGELSGGELSGSYQSRTLLRELAIAHWESARWTGQGTAAFFADISPEAFGESIETHSDIFKLLVDQGVVGLFLYLAVLWAIFRAVRRMGAAWGPAVAALVVTLPLMGVLDVYYRQNTTMAFLWLLLGGCWGLASKATNGAEPVAPAKESPVRR